MNPLNPNGLYIAGSEAGHAGHVLFKVNVANPDWTVAGGGIKDLTKDLPSQLLRLAQDQYLSGLNKLRREPVLYAATVTGVYRFNGWHWYRFTSGLPDAQIAEIHTVPVGGVYVATMGRGVWSVTDWCVDGSFDLAPLDF